MCWLRKNPKSEVTPSKSLQMEMFEKVFGKIRVKMIKEEGIKREVYLDSLGKPTVGIGHLVRPEDNLKVGQVISQNHVEELFRQDVTKAIWAAIDQGEEVGEFEEDFITALTSVNFQLGVNWPDKWPNTYAALKVGNLEKVIRNVMGSLWHKQTPKRTMAFKQALLQEIAENNRKVA